MAQEETPVLPGDIDVLEQAADVAARSSRRAESTTTRATRAAKSPKEPKTTRSRAAAKTPVESAPQLLLEAPTQTIAEDNDAPQIVVEDKVKNDSAKDDAPTSKSVEAAVAPAETVAVEASAEESKVEESKTEATKSANDAIQNAAPEPEKNAEAVNVPAPEKPQVAEVEAPQPVTSEETPMSQERTPAPIPSSALEALPREERPLESRGVRFHGREGRVEVRGRHGMPIVSDPRALRREEREMRDVRDPRETRETREARNPREMRDSEGNGMPGGRLASPMREPRIEGRGEGRSEGREGRGEGREGRGEGREGRGEGRGEGRDNRENQGRGRFERDLPRGRNELDLSTLEEKNLTELREIAKNLNIASTAAMKKTDLVFKILEQQAENHGHQFKKGILDILPDGKGFLRTDGYLAGNEDVYVSQSQIKRFNLKTGDMVTGMVRPPKEMERHFGLLRVEAINGEAPDFSKARKEFEKLTPIFPTEKFKLETEQGNITARVIDLVTPIGKGQRGLIVAPPKAGKTSLIKTVANSIANNHPEVVLIVLLIDERPEEVTDIARSVKGEVVASTFDELPENHMRVAEMVFEKAKRLAEQKKDVVVLLDSLTRLARASNLVVSPSGRTMSGGIDPAAIHRPKRMFGAARNIEEGGSLTILATALVDTGSRMDEYIFEEFKGTGNLDLVLDRNLFDSRIFPAIDINKSGTRRDDLLLSKDDLNATMHLRRTLAALDNDKAINLLIDRLKNTKTNEEFMQIVQRSSRAQGNQ